MYDDREQRLIAESAVEILYEFSLDQGGRECWDELLQPY
jgi:hypothetical protein